MSAPNYLETRHKIKDRVDNYKFLDRDLTDYPFYVNHMMDEYLNNDIFEKYLIKDDLDNARKISWREQIPEMELGKYDKKDNKFWWCPQSYTFCT